MVAKFLHAVLSILVIVFASALLYEAVKSTRDAINDANKQLFDKAVLGRQLDPIAAGLQQKLEAYRIVAHTLGAIYKEEGIKCYNAGSTASRTTGYLRAAVGLQRAWAKELQYIYMTYKIPQAEQAAGVNIANLWADCGCEALAGVNGSVSCYYVDTNATMRYYDSATFTGTPTDVLYDNNVYHESYVQFAANMTQSTYPTGDWQPPYVYTERDGSKHQLVTYTYPVEWDAQGRCTAAAQVDFTLTTAEALLVQYLPSVTSKSVLYNSKGAEGLLVASTGDTPLSDDEVYPALSSANPYPWIYQLLMVAVGGLRAPGAPWVNVTGEMQRGGMYYEAVTVDTQWTVVLQSPMSAFYTSKEDKASDVWSSRSKAAMAALFCMVLLAAAANVVVGFVFAADQGAKRGTTDNKYDEMEGPMKAQLPEEA